MSQRKQRSKRSAVAVLFLRGLGTLLPIILTAFVLVTVVQFANNYITRPVNSFIYWCLEGNGLGWSALEQMGLDPYAQEYLDTAALPIDLQDVGVQTGYIRSSNFTNQLALLRAEREGFFRDLEALCIEPHRLRAAVQAKVHPLIGVVLSVLAVLVAGWTLSGLLGRSLVGGLERLVRQVPMVSSVYSCAKQLVDFFLSENEIEFDSVVAVPYPRHGLWSLGFVTNHAPRTIADSSGKRLVSVFIPSSPMPMTGYTIMVPVDECLPMPLTVDEALRVTISGGVLIPPHEEPRTSPTADPVVTPPERLHDGDLEDVA